MRAEQIRKYDMLRRVQRFLDTWAAKLGSVATASAKQELDALAQAMGVNEQLQAGSTLTAKSHTANLEVLRRDLRKHHMHPVATIAAAHLRETPGFKALQMPDAGVKLAVLVQDAAAMAAAARPYQQLFVNNGRPANFADALVAAADAVRASLDARGASITQKAAARDGLKANSSRAYLVLRLLDAQVRSVLVDDPKLLAAWKSAKRIGKGKVVPIEATIQAPQAPASTSQAKAA